MIKLLKKSGINFSNNKIRLPNWCKRIKIDIGLSENAPQTRIWLENQDDLIVFGFEPVKQNFKTILKGNSKFSNKLNPSLIGKKTFIINCGLGNVTSMKEKKIYVTSKDKGCSSLYKPKWPKILRSEIIKIFSIDEFVKLLPFDKIKFIDHIKSDCQGSDFDILKQASFTLKKTAVYTIECENKQYYNTNNGVNEITEFFKKKNFQKYNWINKILNKDNLKNFIVDDPTFYNKKFVHKFSKNRIFIYQKG